MLRLFYDYLSGETTTIPAGTLRLLLTSISYRAKARKEMRREPPMVPRRPPCPCRWADPSLGALGVALASGSAHGRSYPAAAGMVCDMLHRLAWIYNRRTPAPSYIPYYNRRPVLVCPASRRGGGIWYRLRASGRVCVLQRGAGGIIAACVGLVSWAV